MDRVTLVKRLAEGSIYRVMASAGALVTLASVLGAGRKWTS